MARVKGGPKTRWRRKRILKRAKGFYGARRKLYAVARETVDRAMAFAYVGRKQKKRQFRRLWVVRINAAVRAHDMSYSRFINGLKKSTIEVDRRVMATLAIDDPKGFAALVDASKAALAA